MAATFLSRLTGSSSAKYEPSPRIFHLSQNVGTRVLVQGGRTDKCAVESQRPRRISVVDVFDPYSELWEERQVTGDIPSPGTYYASAASLRDDLFTFGGWDGKGFYNTLHKLDTKTWRWCELSPQNAEGAPMPKYGSGMVSFRDCLGVYGGYAMLWQLHHSFVNNISFTGDRGWTDEFNIYHLKQGMWSCPATTGVRPPPCSGFTFTAVDDRRAVLFGGKNGERGRMNDVFIIDLYTKHWKKLTNSGLLPWPEERGGHAACCLNYCQQYPQLLITGGMDADDEPLSDLWILDVEREIWMKVNVALKPRWGHTITSFPVGHGLTEATMFGGTALPWVGSEEKQPKLADTSLLQFGLTESSGQCQWELLSIIDNAQRGLHHRMMEKLRYTAENRIRYMGESKQGEIGWRELENKGEVGDEDGAEREKRDKAKLMEVEIGRLTAENQMLVREREDERRRITVEKEEAVDRMRAVEKERDMARAEMHVMEEMVREMTDRVGEVQARALELQLRLDEVQQKELVVQEQALAAEQRGPSWEVGEDELEVTEDRLGVGGWAEVKVAKLQVAAKVLHEQLIYDYHRQLFRREMDVAARVSHPNLLRFLGARLEGGMAILTEIMPTSVRALVNRRPRQLLPLEHILSIAKDVACALNYLHHMTPDPMIHRDLSSANVLLQPTPDGGWLAKVSDYGTANFQSQLQTENPGSPVYTAPESRDPALQTPKMDIYSFGVLLLEMCTCQFPVPERRIELIESIKHPKLLDLIVQCLNTEKNKRPTASEIVICLRHIQ